MLAIYLWYVFVLVGGLALLIYIAHALGKERRLGYLAGLEAAAKVCEDYDGGWLAAYCAALIRALKTKEGAK